MKTILTLISPLLVLTVYAQNLDEDLLLHYKFNNNVEDESINDYDGTPFGITYTEDRFGNENGAASFDGDNDFVNFPNLDELKPELPVSFSFWIKYNSESALDRVVFNTSFEEDVNTGVYLTSRSLQGTYAVGYGDGGQQYNNSTIRGYGSNTEILTGEWLHVAVVVSGPTDMQIYVNCEENGGNYNGTGGELVYSDLPGCIGRHDQNTGGIPAYYFDGAIDDFRYWSRALTEEEIELICSEDEFDCPNIMANIGDPCETNEIEGTIDEFCSCIPDAECSNYNYFLADVAPGGSTELFSLEIIDNQGYLAQIATFDNERHIAFNTEDGLVYTVQKSNGAFQTFNPNDASLGNLIPLEYDLDEVIGATFNNEGELLLLSQSLNAIYSIDTETGFIEIYDSYSPVLGGDIELVSDSLLLLATREGSGLLYQAIPNSESNDVILGDAPNLVTGMANTENGQLILSAKETTELQLSNYDGSIAGSIGLFLDGLSFTCSDGDLASGCNEFSSPQISASAANLNFTPYPNPASSSVDVKIELDTAQEVLVTALSMTTYKKTVLLRQEMKAGEQKLEIDVRDLPEGIYVISLESLAVFGTSKLIISR